MQTLAQAKSNYAIWKSKIEKAFEDELKGEIDEDDVELVVEMFVEMVSTLSSTFNEDTIREALDVVSSDDDFDRNSISKEILERIQLSDAHAFPVRTILFSFIFSNPLNLRNAASNDIARWNDMSSSIERR